MGAALLQSVHEEACTRRHSACTAVTEPNLIIHLAKATLLYYPLHSEKISKYFVGEMLTKYRCSTLKDEKLIIHTVDHQCTAKQSQPSVRC